MEADVIAAGEKPQWLHDRGLRLFPLVGWAAYSKDVESSLMRLWPSREP